MYILGTKRDFMVTQKTFFIIVKGLSIDWNCLRPESDIQSLYRLFFFFFT